MIRDKTPQLADFNEYAGTKVYIYVLPFAKKGINMLGQQTYSNVAVTQSLFSADPTKHQMLQDDAGNWYCEAVAAQTETETFRLTSQTSSIADTLSRIKQFQLLSNNFPVRWDTDSLVCTIDSPMTFNSQGQRTDNNPVYIISTSNSTTANVDLDWYAIEDSLLPNQSYSEFMCSDIAILQEKYINCFVSFYRNDSFTFDMIAPNGEVGFDVTTKASGFLANNFIAAEALINDNTWRPDLKLNTTDFDLYPFKASAKNLNNDYAQMTMEWFDGSTYLPLSIAGKFQAPQSLDKIFTNIVANSPEEAAIDALYLMLSWYLLAVGNFQPINAPANWRVNPSQSSLEGLGQIDGQFIVKSPKGKFQRNVLQGSAQNPQVIIDGIYNEWTATYPSATIETKRIIKATICALSRYLASNYAVAGGASDVFKSILPWFLTPSSLSLTFDSYNITLTLTNLNFVFGSEFYSLDSSGNLEPNPQNKYPNQLWEIQGEETTFVKQVDSILTAKGKKSTSYTYLPAQMMTQDDTAQDHLWLIPTTQTDIGKIFTQKTGGSVTINLTFSTDSDAQNAPITDVNTYLIQYLKSIYGQSAQVTINNQGVSNTKLSVSQPYKFNPDVAELPDFESQYPTFPTDVVPNTAQASPIDNVGVEKILNQFADVKTKNGLPANAQLVVTSNNSTGNITGALPEVIFVDIECQWANTQYFISNAQATVTYQSGSFIEGKLVYNRSEWYEYLKASGIDLATPRVIQVREANAEPTTDLQQVSVNSIWLDDITISLQDFTFDIPLFNTEDESLVEQTIVFT